MDSFVANFGGDSFWMKNVFRCNLDSDQNRFILVLFYLFINLFFKTELFASLENKLFHFKTNLLWSGRRIFQREVNPS